jgi:hypothetical protein
VQLEYFGYMKRDPDEAGYNFWLGKLNQFGGNFVNAETTNLNSSTFLREVSTRCHKFQSGHESGHDRNSRVG